jgi:hypothetical protein
VTSGVAARPGPFVDPAGSIRTLKPDAGPSRPVFVLGRENGGSAATSTTPPADGSDDPGATSGGRDAGHDGRDGSGVEPPTALLGRYRARDGSAGAPVGLDLDRPHAALVVGKRGYGKSYTLGVLAEAAARARGVAPVVVDPMGALTGLATAGFPGRVVEPAVRADSVPPSAWPELVGLEPTDAAGALVWRAADAADSVAAMRAHVADAPVDGPTRRAADNHLRLADAWGVFDAAGLAPATLADGAVTVVDCAGLGDAPTNAVVRAVARGLYDARVRAVEVAAGSGATDCAGGCADRGGWSDGTDGPLRRLPWLFVDEAHVAFDGVAAPALRTLLTRGRAPGASLVAATQRPGALPGVAVSQADLLIAHRLTAEPDVEALAAATPTYLRGTLRERLPDAVGAALVVDDVTESVHAVRVRERETPHEGTSPRASDIDVDGDADCGPAAADARGGQPGGRSGSETAE